MMVFQATLRTLLMSNNCLNLDVKTIIHMSVAETQWKLTTCCSESATLLFAKEREREEKRKKNRRWMLALLSSSQVRTLTFTCIVFSSTGTFCEWRISRSPVPCTCHRDTKDTRILFFECISGEWVKKRDDARPVRRIKVSKRAVTCLHFLLIPGTCLVKERP